MTFFQNSHTILNMNIREIYLDLRQKTGTDYNDIAAATGYPPSSVEKNVMGYTQPKDDQRMYEINFAIYLFYIVHDYEPTFDIKDTNHYHDLSKHERNPNKNLKIEDYIKKLIKQKKNKNVKS